MKKIELVTVWEQVDTIEVPDDFKVPDTLDGFPPGTVENVGRHGTKADIYLVDWFEKVPIPA